MYISLEKCTKMQFLPYLDEIEKENLCVLLSVIIVCSFSASLVSQYYRTVFMGNSGSKAEDNAAAARREKRKKWEILSDGGTLGPEQKTPFKLRKSECYIIDNKGEENLRCILKHKRKIFRNQPIGKYNFKVFFYFFLNSKHAWSPLIWMSGLFFFNLAEADVLYAALCMEQ